MKRALFIFFVILLSVTVAYSQETEQGQKAPPTPETPELVSGSGQALALPHKEGGEYEEPLSLPKAEITPRFQAVNLDKDSSKAREYRTLPEGIYIDNILFHYGSQSQEFRSEVLRVYPLTNLIKDGYGTLDYRRYGLLDIDVTLSGFPHDYANDAQSIFHLENPYTYTVEELSPLDISTQRDNYDLLLKFTPGDRLTISTNLSIEDRAGRRPLALENFTANNSTAIAEIAEPVDYKTTTIDLGMEYINDVIDIQLNDNLQIFSNNLRDEVIWDNPYIPGATGKAKVADDYTVHTLSLRPSVKLTDNWRLVNTLTYSKVTSSIDLAPFSTADVEDETFKVDILDTDVRNLTFSSILSIRPLTSVRLNIKYRYHTYENDTPKIEEPLPYVMIDGNRTALPAVIRYSRIPRYMSYSINSIGLDGVWSLTNRLSLDGGIEAKYTSRGEREVDKENEERFFISLHSTITDKLSGRLGYAYDRRRGDYDPAYYNVDYDPGSNVSQHPLMRSFDLSGLDSNSITASINYSLTDALSLSSALSLIISEHPDVAIGRRHSQGESASINAQYMLRPYLLIYSEYFYDRREIEGSYAWTYNPDFASEYPQDLAYPGFTIPFTGIIEDRGNVYGIGFNYDIDKGLSITGRYNRYDFTGTGINLPEVNSMTDVYEIKASYRPYKEIYVPGCPPIYFKDIKIDTGYYMEIYRRDDYALDNFPAYGTGTDIFLGIREPEYRLSIFSILLNLYF